MKPGRKLVEQGASACTEADLLAILVGTGGRGYGAEDVARDILARYGTAAGLMDAPLAELARIRGVGPVKAIRIAAAYELTARMIRHLEQHG